MDGYGITAYYHDGYGVTINPVAMMYRLLLKENRHIANYCMYPNGVIKVFMDVSCDILLVPRSEE